MIGWATGSVSLVYNNNSNKINRFIIMPMSTVTLHSVALYEIEIIGYAFDICYIHTNMVNGEWWWVIEIKGKQNWNVF